MARLCPNSRTLSEQIASTFWTSPPLRQREVKELLKYGAAAAVPASAPVRAGYGEFNENGFKFKQDGARVFLFLLTNEQGEAKNILAWAPQLNRLSSCYCTIAVHAAYHAENAEICVCLRDGQEEIL